MTTVTAKQADATERPPSADEIAKQLRARRKLITSELAQIDAMLAPLDGKATTSAARTPRAKPRARKGRPKGSRYDRPILTSLLTVGKTGASAQEIAQAVGLDPRSSYVYKPLRALVKAGHVRSGKAHRWVITDKGKAALKAMA